jgi:glycyl-tRNA synthetase
MCNAFTEEVTGEEGNEKKRIYLKFKPALAPVKAAVLPLTKKDGLPEKAREIYKQLKSMHNVVYEEAASIGKRYTRQDLIGTPYCIAVDHQTLEDDTVTIRDRDTTSQERMSIDDAIKFINDKCSFQHIFASLD